MMQDEAGAPLIPVRLFAAAAAAIGEEETAVPARTVAEAITALGERTHEEGRRVLARSSVLVNSVATPDRERELGHGDRLDVLPPFAGG